MSKAKWHYDFNIISHRGVFSVTKNLSYHKKLEDLPILIQRDGGFYSPQSFDQFIILDSAVGIIKNVKKLGYLCVVISNQPDISRGYLKQTELDKMTDVLYKELYIDDVFYCTHDDSDKCNSRKPAPGLLLQAADKWNINLDKSYMIGDTLKDVEAAKCANVKYFLLNSC